ncbi:lymphatic vessel endothelial hyaluronic acid receptor 1a [Labrus bergylta]|uniref:lymphatic vessel endothelial hyaluronic acid receptor 1a n=1 Tax=Labrus bergylta TaxID=56723 RepID=UPI0033137D46
MTMLCLCITLLMSIASVTSDRNINTSHIRVFPGTNQSVAGVFQVSFINQHNKPEYIYNASEARQLCSSLGVKLASKSEVRTALSRGFETCRYGWIDEHFAVIPRIKALSNCGQNQTGLLTWRTSVTETFDVFCFNESDAAIQLRDTTTDSSSRYSTQTLLSLSSSTSPPSSSSTPETSESEEKSALFVGRAQGFSGGKAILIITTCALFLIAVVILAYLKLRNSHTDVKQQPEEYIETEEWTSVKVIKETQTAAQEDERIEVDDDTS